MDTDTEFQRSAHTSVSLRVILPLYTVSVKRTDVLAHNLLLAYTAY